MVGAEVEVGGADGTHPPLGLAGNGIPLVVARRARDDLVAVLVHRSGGRGRQLLSEGEKIMLINFFFMDGITRLTSVVIHDSGAC